MDKRHLRLVATEPLERPKRSAAASSRKRPSDAASPSLADGKPNLRNLNLNLLPVFLILAEQHNLSRAAELLGMSQSAVSHALTKLRAQFGDPLFIRAKHGMEPTPRALQLATPISQALSLIRDQVVGWPAPASKPGAFALRCGMTNPLDEGPALVTNVMQALRSVAPDATPTFSLVRDVDWKRLLRLRQVDLVFDTALPTDEDLSSQVLAQRDLVCYVRRGNPLAEQPLTLERYLAASHVVLDVAGSYETSPVRRALASDKGERLIAARVHTHFHAALMVSQSDLVGTGFRQDFMHYARQFELERLDCPVAITPSPLVMTWLRCRNGECEHRRIRNALANLCEAET